MPTAPRLMYSLLLALAGLCALLHAGPSRAAESQSVLLSIPQLRELGIALDLSAVEPAQRPRVPPGADRPFPHRCFGMVSVSDELLARMQSQGFSLATLCIGLDSPHLAFHPETGAPLTSVRVRYQKAEDGMPDDPRGVVELLVDIPRCFARGNPYVDCKIRYDYMGGSKAEEETAWFSDKGKKIAELMQRARAKGLFERACTCADFGKPDPDFDAGPALRSTGACRAASVPQCPRSLSRWTYPGSLVYDFESWWLGSDEKLVKRLGLPADQTDWGVLNEVFEISPDLPNGYAYRYLTPEGETAKAMTTQEKGRILSVGTK